MDTEDELRAAVKGIVERYRQPAIVEEIFFRHTALLTMRESMGETSAIWTTGVMFGFTP